MCSRRSNPCNCKDKERCPMKEEKTSCRTENVIYRAEVTTEKERKTYIGLTSMEIKKRISKHRTDFSHKKYQEATKLSNYIWKLKEKNIDYKINWKIIKKS